MEAANPRGQRTVLHALETPGGLADDLVPLHELLGQVGQLAFVVKLHGRKGGERERGKRGGGVA